MMRRLLLPVLACVPAWPALAGEYITPPILPVPDAWQGRATGVVRVLDKLDAHVELLTLSAGQAGHYKSLSVTLRSCMDRPDGMPHDSAAFLDVQDTHGNGQPFTGWTFANEPSIGVFESPVYGVQLVSCQGALVAPAAPPLPAPVPAPPGLLRSIAPPAADTSQDGSTDTGAPDGVDGSQPDTMPPGQNGAGTPAPNQPQGQPQGQLPGQSPGQSQIQSPNQAPAAPATQPDAVYPDGAPPRGG